MTNTQTHEQDGCLMCAVRALTEGTPASWRPENEGDMISGVVLRLGVVGPDLGLGDNPFVDLWMGGLDRYRVVAYGANLRAKIEREEPKIGDRLTVRFDGMKAVASGRHRNLNFKAFTVTVERGHHG